MSRTFAALVLAAGLVAAPALAQEDSDWRDDPKVMACAPKVLKKGSALTLTLGPRHGAELAIQRAGTRDWYFIITGGPEPQHFMTPKDFQATKRVTLNENTQGYGPPKGELVKIFSRPGRYVVHISDKLESEAGGNKCTVNYTGSGK